MEGAASPFRKCPKIVSKRFFDENIFVHLEYNRRRGVEDAYKLTKDLEAQKARMQQYPIVASNRKEFKSGHDCSVYINGQRPGYYDSILLNVKA